jgi:trimethylamine:corrinoid methyltransferase-like protein
MSEFEVYGNTLPGSPWEDNQYLFESEAVDVKPAEMSNIELLLAMVEMDTISKDAGQLRKELTVSISKFMTEQEQYKIMLSILEQDEIVVNARKGMSELMAEAKIRREQLKDLIRRGEFSLEGNE